MRTLSALLLLVALSEAHEARPCYLEITETAPGRYDVLWRTPVLLGMQLSVTLRLPEDVRDVAEPTVRELSDARIERRRIEKGGGLGGARIEFVGLEATITDVLVRVQTLDGRSSTTLVNPSRPWVEVRVTTGLVAVLGAYVLHGIQHISFGVDHLLFVLGLLLIVRDRWMLVKTVTAFTVAHSITLAIATLGYASAPVEPLNAAVALSILFLGPEVVRTWRGGTSFTIRHPWVAAFAFGLVHGFGFAGALTGAGLPPRELPVALLGFNVGVEIGQVAFVLLILALERSFRQLQIRWSRWAAALPGYAVGSLGAFWTIQTTAVLMGLAI
jgi:hypothetical protein